jgi:hypothetical protein
MLSLATCVPQSHIHGEISDNFIVIYSYDIDEFYSNEWKSETKYYIKHVKHINHNTIRNYKKIIKHISEKMQLVEIFRINDVDICILHTYKINILKRLWKKHSIFNYVNMS